MISDTASRYATDTIVILGKGASADEVDSKVFSNSVVIGINDSERIFPCDVTVLHSDWVIEALDANHFRSSAYVAPWSFAAGGRQVVTLPRFMLTSDSVDQMMGRLMAQQPGIEDVLFITALRIARSIAEVRGQRQRVYMVGFDFDVAGGYSKYIDGDYSSASTEARDLVISPQEHYFLHALYLLRDAPDIEILHVGRKSYSAISPAEMQFGGPSEAGQLHAPHSVSVVAELTTNHFGERMRLERMIRASAAAGADYVKLQKREVESFYSKEQLQSPYLSPYGETFADYRNQLELDAEDFLFVDRLCGELGLGWFTSILDRPSFDFMLQFDPQIVKLPSTISEHTEYLRHVAHRFQGAVVVSTGMTDGEYERFILDEFDECDRLYLLQCNSAYPTPIEDCNVAVVSHYAELAKEDPRIVPGYSSHDRGWFASGLAVAAGARMVEKHVKLGDTEWAHFDAVAVDLSTGDFTEFVQRIREAEIILGSDVKTKRPSEHHKYPRLTSLNAGAGG